MLFWTVVLFIAYSVIYFVISQRKIRSLTKSNVELNMSLEQKTMLLQKAKKHIGHYENEMAG
jgi:hypothetical protein